MSKYEIARQGMAGMIAAAAERNVTEPEILETLIVVAVEALAKSGGREKAAGILRYELSNVGGDVDTVFLRSR
jgi:hypothetical protein